MRNERKEIFLSLAGVLGSLSVSVSLLISPLTIGICRRKSTRVTAVMGGLVVALGCLFSSFASQFHQLYLSYGIMLGKSTHLGTADRPDGNDEITRVFSVPEKTPLGRES